MLSRRPVTKTFTIPKGGHYSRGMRLGLIFQNSVLRFRAHFRENCLYEPMQNPGQINKLYGNSYGFHHRSSARIGWRSDGREIELLSYVYTAPNRLETRFIACIPVNERHEFHILRSGNEVSLGMEGKEAQIFGLADPRAWGYRLFPYFGGEHPAPHDMQIDIEVLAGSIC